MSFLGPSQAEDMKAIARASGGTGAVAPSTGSYVAGADTRMLAPHDAPAITPVASQKVMTLIGTTLGQAVQCLSARVQPPAALYGVLCRAIKSEAPNAFADSTGGAMFAMHHAAVTFLKSMDEQCAALLEENTQLRAEVDALKATKKGK